MNSWKVPIHRIRNTAANFREKMQQRMLLEEEVDNVRETTGACLGICYDLML